MKRNPNIKTLSFEHHDGLVMARKIEQSFKNTDKPEDMVAYVQDIYLGGLDHHFKQEEDSLFPALQKFKEAQLVLAQVEQEHKRFLELYKLICTNNENVYTHIRAFGKLLNDHIRYEERVFFPLVEELLTENELVKIGIYLNKQHRPLNKECRI